MTNNIIPETNKCYRHPDRETFVSCGKCGRPLCTDCVRHGPVGVRCIDCLRPSYGRASTDLHAVVDVDKARWMTLILVVIFAGIIGKIASAISVIDTIKISGDTTIVNNINLAGPNLFICMIAGFLTGYIIWRIVGKTWNYTTLWLAAGAGVIIPVAGAILSLVFSKDPTIIKALIASMNIKIIHLIIHTTIASLLSGGLAALAATNPRGPEL